VKDQNKPQAMRRYLLKQIVGSKCALTAIVRNSYITVRQLGYTIYFICHCCHYYCCNSTENKALEIGSGMGQSAAVVVIHHIWVECGITGKVPLLISSEGEEK
jgi:hypothetical protein